MKPKKTESLPNGNWTREQRMNYWRKKVANQNNGHDISPDTIALILDIAWLGGWLARDSEK